MRLKVIWKIWAKTVREQSTACFSDWSKSYQKLTFHSDNHGNVQQYWTPSTANKHLWELLMDVWFLYQLYAKPLHDWCEHTDDSGRSVTEWIKCFWQHHLNLHLTVCMCVLQFIKQHPQHSSLQKPSCPLFPISPGLIRLPSPSIFCFHDCFHCCDLTASHQRPHLCESPLAALASCAAGNQGTANH